MAMGTVAVKLAVQDVCVRFGRRDVFGSVSLTVASGGVVAVSGPNGSGKSTLLRAVCGLLSPSGGTVCLSVADRQVPQHEVRRHIGLSAPDLGLYRFLTASEHLQFAAQMHGVDGSIDRMRDLLTLVGLRGRGRDAVGSYSTGMRHRLRYALALIHEPALLVLDEPTANLDAEGATVVKSIVERQRGHGAVLMATNEASETSWADHVCVLGSARS